ncbi:MAG: Cys-tRNA(Pro) deacylase [Planctomycetes bacterium]|nr:Cys-tRNA(Pro) deacylase [Planctomycetota bacterium]
MSHPITSAIRVLRQHKVEFEPYLYDYVERGGTSRSSTALGIDEHKVVKTLVFENDAKLPLIVLMHGDRQVSTKSLARHLGVKSITPCKPEVAEKWTGYVVGGTSPFGTRSQLPIFAERTILEQDRIWINGGKRGFLVAIAPQVLVDVLDAQPVDVAIEKDT